MEYKLGSLFDGSGGFPLAGFLCDIEPRWAAEVEPYPIAVTRSRFPNMRHLGDISKVNGGEIEPVDIVTFGSPCTDMSVAGLRAGLDGKQSVLFYQAVRIIKEMRQATNGKHPTFALWENVPGAFSSNKGEDFRTVIEELIRIIEPTAVMPEVPKAGWAYSDSYTGDGWSLAYRVFDAQHWGVPQRRRRIHLVIDFRGERAREVLFEREGVRGYFAEGRTPWQATTADAQRCLGADDRERGINPRSASDSNIAATLYAAYGTKWNGNSGAYNGENFVLEPIAAATQQGGIAVVETKLMDAYQHHGWRENAVCETLTAGQNDTVRGDTPLVCVPYTLKIRSGCEGGGKGALIQEDKSATLATNNDQYLFQPVIDGHILDDQGGQQVNVRTDGKSPTLRAEMHGNIPAAMSPVGCLASSAVNAEITDGRISPCLMARAGTGGNQLPLIALKDCATPIHDQATRFSGKRGDKADGKGNGLGVGEPGDPMNTLTAGDRHAVAYQTYQKVTGPLMANSHPGSYCGQDAYQDMLIVDKPSISVRYIVRRLTPTECARLQGFADCWGHIDDRADFTDEEYRFWLDVRNTHAVINGKAEKEYTKAQMLTWYNKLHTDSAEYKMWGNGIALPPALYCMQGMVDALNSKKEDANANLTH